jgi:abortive infection bacteriophage resistance protein
VRNVCAHHARLWKRELAVKPMLPHARHAPEWHVPAVLTMLRVLLLRVAPRSRWKERLFALHDTYGAIPPADMGMPPDWRQYPVWR